MKMESPLRYGCGTSPTIPTPESYYYTCQAESKDENEPRLRTPPVSATIQTTKYHVDATRSGKPINRKRLDQKEETYCQGELRPEDAKSPETVKPETQATQTQETWAVYSFDRATLIRSITNYLLQTLDSSASLPDFEGDEVPAISLHDYVERLIKYTDMWASEKNCPSIYTGLIVALLAVEYIDRLKLKYSMLAIHRLLMCGFFLGIKVIEDFRISSLYWSKVGGVELDELNRMELSFVKLLNWRVRVTADEFRAQENRFAESKC